MTRLKEEEVRLNQIKEEISMEKHLLEQRKISAMHDIQTANQIKSNIQLQYDEIKYQIKNN